LYVIVSCTLAIDPVAIEAGAQATAPAVAGADPDALYGRRDQGDAARQAADLWSAQLKSDPKAFEAAWKLSRACYWLGTHGEEAARRAALERGMEAARTAAALEPKRPEGPFWLAANMGTLAESFGMRQGIKYRKPIRESLELVLKLDPAFQQGSADRALGRWYFKVPGLFGGSNEKSEQHLRKSLTYNPNSTASWFFLGETLLDMGRKPDAKQAFQKVIDAPFDPDWTPEDREWKAKARQKLDAVK
jgi:tetratricopeptide (TPR) repeat protein